MIWDWDMWPYVIARGLVLAYMTEAFAEISDAFTRMAEQIGKSLMPALERLTKVLES